MVEVKWKERTEWMCGTCTNERPWHEPVRDLLLSSVRAPFGLLTSYATSRYQMLTYKDNHDIYIVSFWGNTMLFISTIAIKWGTGSERNLIAEHVSRLSLSEIMVHGRTNIGQLVSQLSAKWDCGSGRTIWGLNGFFSTFRLACSNRHQENEEVWRCSTLGSIC